MTVPTLAGNILWPLPYRAAALRRAESEMMGNPSLSELYKTIFRPNLLRLPPIPVPIPFAREVSDQAEAAKFFDHQAELPLSIITVSRNDNHVERMQERTQAFIDDIYYLAEKFERPVELIIVEWNPPPDRPPMKEAFTFPRKHHWASCRIVTVPNTIHHTFDVARQIPLHQMIGKNIGIRRARGEYILSTNIDILFSEELFNYITGPDMQGERVYRGNRWDISRQVLDIDGAASKLAHARDLCFQINYPHATIAKESKQPTERDFIDFADYLQIPRVHTMGCGDFQLMHRDSWAHLRGFCELDTFSFHIDSLFALTCYYAGVKEINFGNELPHYHIDHTLGAATKTNVYVTNKKEMEHLSLAGIINLVRNMEEHSDFYVFNKPNWGLAGIDLPIQTVTTAPWETCTPLSKVLTEDNSKGSYPGYDATQINIDKLQTKQLRDITASVSASISNYLKTHKQGAKIHIWGTGQRAIAFYEDFTQNGIAIDSFIFSDGHPAPDTIHGIPAIPASAFKKDIHDLIVICSMYVEEIISQLRQRNYKEGSDYLVAF